MQWKAETVVPFPKSVLGRNVCTLHHLRGSRRRGATRRERVRVCFNVESTVLIPEAEAIREQALTSKRRHRKARTAVPPPVKILPATTVHTSNTPSLLTQVRENYNNIETGSSFSKKSCVKHAPQRKLKRSRGNRLGGAR